MVQKFQISGEAEKNLFEVLGTKAGRDTILKELPEVFPDLMQEIKEIVEEVLNGQGMENLQISLHKDTSAEEIRSEVKRKEEEEGKKEKVRIRDLLFLHIGQGGFTDHNIELEIQK